MGERFKEVRETLGLEQSEYSERLGIKPDDVVDIENGKSELTEPILFSVCREFNINVQWLRTGHGEMRKA